MMTWHREVSAVFKTVDAIINDGLSMPTLHAMPLASRAVYLSFAGVLTGRALELITDEYQRTVKALEEEKAEKERERRRAERSAKRAERAFERALEQEDADELVSTPADADKDTGDAG